jgi:hypothetical protein
MAATTKRTPRDLDERTLLKLADYLLKSVPGREGVLAVQGGQRVRSFRGEQTTQHEDRPARRGSVLAGGLVCPSATLCRSGGISWLRTIWIRSGAALRV